MTPINTKGGQAPFTILTVDDEPFIAIAISFALAGPNRRVVTANDGPDAFAKIASEPSPFDLIITDHSMPAMSGLALVQRLRATNFAGKIAVLSAHLTEANRRAYADLRVDEMLPKPFDLEKLRAVINNLHSVSA